MDSTTKLSDKAKLLVVLSRVPSTLDKGDKLRAYNQLLELSNHFEVLLLCLNTENKKHDLTSLNSICKEVVVYPIKKFSIIFNLIKCVFSSKPFQVSYFYNGKIKKAIDKKIKEFNPDHIYAQLIRTSEYVKDQHTFPKTLDYMDAFSKGIERRVEGVPIYLKFLYKSEYQRLLRYESRIFEYFENKTIISEVDRDFIYHRDKNKIQIVSNGVDNAFFDGSDKWVNDKKLLFTGNMSYAPNVKAAEFIVQELSKELPDFSITLAGASPDPGLVKSANKQIVVTGWVEDIKDCYRKGKIFIAPMFIGTGIQNKILESMAMGIPCITTSLANKPLKAKVGEEILIADTKEEFITQIKRLDEDSDLYHKIAKNAQLYVKENYSWAKSTNDLIQLMEN